MVEILEIGQGQQLLLQARRIDALSQLANTNKSQPIAIQKGDLEAARKIQQAAFFESAHVVGKLEAENRSLIGEIEQLKREKAEMQSSLKYFQEQAVSEMRKRKATDAALEQAQVKLRRFQLAQPAGRAGTKTVNGFTLVVGGE